MVSKSLPVYCRSRKKFEGENHMCRCQWPGCNGAVHICYCGHYWITEVKK